jgi:hypothetical protein
MPWRGVSVGAAVADARPPWKGALISDKGKQVEATRFEGEPHHGWSPDQASDDDTAAGAGAGDKAMQKPSQETGEDREISQARREGISDTDMEPKSPSGDSHGRSGEDIATAKGKKPEGHKGVSQRPYGTSG